MSKPDALREYLRLPLFDGFPYLVTKIAGPIHHLIVLPRELPLSELERLAELQWRANRLPTCLVVAADRAQYIGEEGTDWADVPPRADNPVCDRLLAAEEFAPTPELVARQQHLRESVASRPSLGYFVDRAHGRVPTADDRIRFSESGPEGVPRDLRRCEVCRGWRGDALLLGPDLVVQVFCFCQNQNLCARCMGQLGERRLDDCAYFEDEGRVLHVPAFTALEHQCPSSTRSAMTSDA